MYDSSDDCRLYTSSYTKEAAADGTRSWADHTNAVGPVRHKDTSKNVQVTFFPWFQMK